ncbi:MAG: diadenylate cyclase CdaA [Candidatus Dormibacteria bacterium]
MPNFQDLLLFLHSRSWLDLVDITIVALLIYWILLLIRGTQAFQIAIGIAVLGGLGLLAETLHLQLLSFIFERIGPAVLVLLLILFQPELRRALERVGRFPLVGRTSTQGRIEAANRAAAEVVRAVGHLASRRIGALIVLERGVGLDNHLASGVRVDGALSAEFLESIFHPGGPLHDGAVIVRGLRVVAASCVLPLADEMQVRERVGTRHRAALGLTLQSDALVVVVSEESGLVSLVERGRIEREVDSDHLKRALSVRLAGPLRPASLVRRLREQGGPAERAPGDPVVPEALEAGGRTA